MKFDRRTADALYRVSFGAFAYAPYAVLYPNRPLVPNWHIKCICHRLPWRLPAEPHIRLRETRWSRSTSRDVLAQAASNFRQRDLRDRPATAESTDYRPPRR